MGYRAPRLIEAKVASETDVGTFGMALGVILAFKSATFGPQLRWQAMKDEVQEPLEKKISKSRNKKLAREVPRREAHRGGVGWW